MKKYMVIMVLDGESSVYFTDDYLKAENARMDAEVGLGAYVEVYARQADEDGVESYSIAY